MLKFILSCIILIPAVVSGEAIQSCLFVLTFLFGLFCHHDFRSYIRGWCFNIDSLSYILILLRFWITRLVVCSRQKVLKDKNFSSIFLLVNLLLLLSLILTFSVSDYLLFYIRFERSLIPTLILILG